MREAHVHSFDRDAQSSGNLLGRNAVQGRFLFVHHEMIFDLRVFDIRVNVDHAFSLVEDIFNLPGNFNLALVVWAIDLCNQRL